MLTNIETTDSFWVLDHVVLNIDKQAEKQATIKASRVNGAIEQQDDVLRTVRKRAVSHGATQSRQAAVSLAQDGTAPPADECMLLCFGISKGLFS
jgi:hypothetical protein